MTLSPSEMFQYVVAGNSMHIEKYLSLRPKMTVNGTRVRVVYVINQNSPLYKHRSIVVNNPLAMMQAIAILRKELQEDLANEKKLLEKYEQEQVAKAFLDNQRKMIAQKHRDQMESQQKRIERAVRNVRGPIQEVLRRVKPAIDPWSYTNVYGKPAEVFIF